MLMRSDRGRRSRSVCLARARLATGSTAVTLCAALHLSGCLEEGLEALLKASGSNLLILKISHCPNLLTDRSLWLASCYCRALQAVTYRWVSEVALT